MKKLKYIYIAAPYEKPDPVTNVRRVVAVAEKLVRLGYVPFIPHLTMLWHFISPHEVEFWYAYDNEWIRRCDGLLRLEGESKGAHEEVILAVSLNIPVFFSISELLEY